MIAKIPDQTILKNRKASLKKAAKNVIGFKLYGNDAVSKFAGCVPPALFFDSEGYTET